MVEIKILEAKRAAAATGHSSGVKRNPGLPLQQDLEQPDRILKRRSGSLKRGAEVTRFLIQNYLFASIVIVALP